jgi:hypothetical protein
MCSPNLHIGIPAQLRWYDVTVTHALQLLTAKQKSL